MGEICKLEISRLLEYGLQRGLIAPEDKAYAANRMLALLGLREFEPQPVEEELHTPVEPLERLCQFAAEAGLIEPDTRDGRDQFDTELMNCLMPRPSQVVREFYSLYEKDKQAATDYYYQLARSSNYIRVDRIEKDRMWTAPTPYGDLVITINLSKPEKDPKAIAAAKNAPQSGYPKCALCRENEGYLGSANQAARGNHRLIPLELGGEPWFLQYSPYVYYNCPTTLWAPTRTCPLWAAPSSPTTTSRAAGTSSPWPRRPSGRRCASPALRTWRPALSTGP